MTPIRYNPWTGKPRDERDIESDPEGKLLIPPGVPLVATKNYEYSLEGVFHRMLVGTGRFNKKSQGYIMGAFRDAVTAITAPAGASTQEKANG